MNWKDAWITVGEGAEYLLERGFSDSPDGARQRIHRAAWANAFESAKVGTGTNPRIIARDEFMDWLEDGAPIPKDENVSNS